MKKTLFIVLIALTSCDMFQEPEYSVDPKLASYVEQFFAEAAARGINLSHTNLIVEFHSTESKSGISYTHKGQKIIRINNYLKDGNDLRLKIVTFHELGHALLFRPHLDSNKSIMNTSPCINCEIDKYFLDELFRH